MRSLNEQELAYISGHIKSKYGVDLEVGKIPIESRLGYYLSSKGFQTYSDYFKFAKRDSEGELADLVYRLTTKQTSLLREKEQFEAFRGIVLPWIESLPDGYNLRLWSTGCGAGEEPYSISISILEYYMTKRRLDDPSLNTTILASDISDRALSAASEGIYLHKKLSAMPPEWASKYFIDLGNGSFRVSPGLRANVAFKKINLLDKYAIRRPFHTIFCRDVLSYFDLGLRKAMIDYFYGIMAAGAYLFIGQTESLANLKHGFQYVQPSVYRKPRQ